MDIDSGHPIGQKITLRLIPFLLILYIVAFLDRTNIGFAQLQMQRDLGFGDVTYGFGAGIFFLGYCLFEVPSNLILKRIGARLWITRIMVTWGIAVIAMMWTQNELEFYLLRFLLGVAEAGFFPGVIFYLTFWFTTAERARIIALFMLAVPLATLLGAPLSAALLGMDGLCGLRGWQWLFIVEGLPTMLLGLIVAFYLPDNPMKARWLSADQQQQWIAHLESGRNLQALAPRASSRTIFKSPEIWLLSLLYFLLLLPAYTIHFWLPQI